ncbi:ABC transporter substrate-binding protein [Pseudalkalibacillus salsuginis]|uniref:ABC transporter substrate-binding protein n=1 Tax=Pseudalkalibacillus salsuginis TaxID=2910972 RepID=UPI001F4527A2|nr:sugar ABC transporter substrate-binding protein [Pseudalkalibacillus salsuginis]MCF6409100.1 sugar ABC transporter substrate-binding protein [Pseudalkalibacillus salsuginis]
MVRIKQSITIFSILFLITSLITGCLGGTDATGTTKKDGVVQLKFTYWGGPLEKKAIEGVIKDFNDSHPKIQVNPQQVQGSYLEKMNTMASSNTLPDLGYFSEGSLPTWLENGKIKDLKPLFESGEINEKLDYAIFQFDDDGPIGGASVANEVYNIYYNKDLFDEKNIPYPPTKAEDAWTWEEFIDVAKKLTVDRNGKHPDDPGFDPKNIKTYGVNNFSTRYEPYIYSNGGGIVSLDGKDILIDEPETIEALQKIADLMYVHHVMPKPSDLSTIPNVDTALLTKRVGMTLDGQWALQELGKAKVDKNLNLGIGVLPKFKEPVTSSEGTPIVVFDTKNSKENWDETKEFLKFIMDPENSLPLIQSGLWMPNEVQWYKDPELIKKWTDNPVHPPEYKEAVIDWAMNNVRQNPNYYWKDRSKVNQILTPALDQLWSGEKTAEEVVKDDIMPKIEKQFGDKYSN